LPSNSAELLTKGRGAQSETEKCKLKGTSKHQRKREIKTSFDAQPEQLGNHCPKIPDGSEIYLVRLKPLHTPILIRPTTSGRHNLASIQQYVSNPPTSPHNSGQKSTTSAPIAKFNYKLLFHIYLQSHDKYNPWLYRCFSK